MRKIWAIAYKELYTTFTDRNLILIMIATPLVLATIIGTAFSGFLSGGGSDVPIRDIPLAVVNLDVGTSMGDGRINHGQTFVDLLVPADPDAPSDNTLHELTNAVELNDPAAARAGVDDGQYAGAIIIPLDFSRSVTYSQDRREIEPTAIDVYVSSASPVSASIIRSLAEGIGYQIATGNIAVAATIETLVARAQSDPVFGLQFGAASATGEFNPDFGAAFDPDYSPLQIEQQTVTGEAASFNPLVSFGSALTIFFMTFTALGGANSLLEEKRAWTLQRLLSSPTPRMTILLGKMAGTFVTCVVQVLLLFVALTLVGSVISGEFQIIWGTNFPAILLVILAAAAAASGLGILVTALVRTPEQGNMIGGLISIVMGVLGGAFFSIDAIPALIPISRLTPNYWGLNAFTKLSQNQSDIGLNVLVLIALGAVMFLIGMFIFNRRLEA
jgi:ABC-2 type transport system permease protein